MLAGRSLRGLVVSEASACLIHGCSWPGVAHNRVKRPYAEENELDDPSKARDQNYVDRLKITARAGAGGNGSVSFWRSIAKGKHTPADGGNGAPGGSVVLRASSHMRSLAGVQQLYRAEAGGHGSKQKQNGRAGRDTVVLVPVGTVVSRIKDPAEMHAADGAAQGQRAGARRSAEDMPEWLQRWRQPWVGSDTAAASRARSYDDFQEEEAADAAFEDDHFDSAASSDTASLESGSSSWDGTRVATTGEALPGSSEYEEVLADLVEHGQEVVVAAGGTGGRGNAAARALPRRPAPATAERGTPGEVARLRLELKLLADVALVGLPNVGKSSLLRALSAATPRVAAYSFTTLVPQLGAADLGAGAKLVLADVPGLIQGAHANRGLGHRFLRHVERTRALAFVIDAAGATPLGSTPLKPWQQLELLREEVGRYSPALLARPWLVVANKVDLLPRPGATLGVLRRRCEAAGWHVPVVGASAVEALPGTKALRTQLRGLVHVGEA